MASIKVKYRASSIENREGTIYYQIIHERRVRQLPTAFRILAEEWDESRSMVRFNPVSDRNIITMKVRDGIRRDLERLTKINNRLSAQWTAYTSEDVIDEYHRYSWQYSMFNYIGCLADRLHDNGKTRTSETYRATLKSFRRFRGGDDLMLDCLTPEIMEAYEAWLRSQGASANTISFYIRILRATYNRAVDEDAIENRNPFRRVYTGIDRTVKRAVGISDLSRIRRVDLSEWPHLAFARDMFMMSFFLRGMSFIDMAFLRKSDLQEGHVVYRRRKTGQRLKIEWTAEMQEILDRYSGHSTRFLLPIIREEGEDEIRACRNGSHIINLHLKRVAALAGVNQPLSMYVARHSWASAAKAMGIPLSVISEGMGHDSEATTRIYLASLDSRIVDEANSRILSSL